MAISVPSLKPSAANQTPLIPVQTPSGYAYATASRLVQHAAYLLSDKIFSYSPPTFHLDHAIVDWVKPAAATQNIFGYVPDLRQLDARLGALSVAAGYVLSPEFDLERSHVPQTVLTSVGSLSAMRESFSYIAQQQQQLSQAPKSSSPLVVHVSSVDDNGRQLVSDYASALELLQSDLALAQQAVLLTTTHESETYDMAVLATLIAARGGGLLVFNLFDGLSAQNTFLAREPCKSEKLADLFALPSSPHAANDPSDSVVVDTLQTFNQSFNTKYRSFEYQGHSEPETVIVTFGSLESTITNQVCGQLAADQPVGVVSVRIYRPFEPVVFLQTLPRSATKLVVLGQVSDSFSVNQEHAHSPLYQDVLAALAFVNSSSISHVVEFKYSSATIPDHQVIASIFLDSLGQHKAEFPRQIFSLPSWNSAEIGIWTLDESPLSEVFADVATLLGNFPEARVSSSTSFDNLTQGGVRQIRLSASGQIMPLRANVTVVASEKILAEFDVLRDCQKGGSVVLLFPEEDVNRTLPPSMRRLVAEQELSLYTLNLGMSAKDEPNQVRASRRMQFALCHILQKLVIPIGSLGPVAFGPDGPSGVNENEASETLDALTRVVVPDTWLNDTERTDLLPAFTANSFVPCIPPEENPVFDLQNWHLPAKAIVFKEAYSTQLSLRPETAVKTSVIHVKEHRRLTPLSYDRNVFHIEFDLGTSGVTYAIGEALGIHAENDPQAVSDFIEWYGVQAEDIIQAPSREDDTTTENRTVFQALLQNVDLFGKPPKRFYEALAEFATDETERKKLVHLSSPNGAAEFKRRSEIDTMTCADVLQEFTSAHPPIHQLVRIVAPLKRREYSIASSQHVTPNAVSLLIVTVEWTDPRGRKRSGMSTRYLNALQVGSPVTVSVKPSVMKLPQSTTTPIIMAGLGTGLAPFRAFVQERAYQRHVLKQPIGAVLLYLGSRHQREEYLYGEEWEAYQQAGVITLIGAAFSRDQPAKIYIQDRMRQTMEHIQQSYIRDGGSFYLCGPTWPVPDVTQVLQEAVEEEQRSQGVRRVNGKKEIEVLKEAGRFVLEVY